ncbi:MAG: acetate kinase [Thainema sp.]
MKILVLNAGSSSQKSGLYDIGDTLPDTPPAPLWEAQLDWTHQEGKVDLEVTTHHGATCQQQLQSDSRFADTQRMLESLWAGDTQVIESPQQIDAVGHRVVHGGEQYASSTLITPDVKATISDLSAFAPLHNPVNLDGIEIAEQILGTNIPQVAVFDTAFHRQMPEAASVYPGPYEWVKQGIRRYGFHGTSHQYCAQRAAQLLDKPLAELKLIVCHLGNGCSLSAIRDGRSIDTTMGFTPLDGLMMGTRSGSVDPGILIHLMRQKNDTANDLDRLLNKQSGLKGLSGVSGDMRQIQTAIADGNQQAKLAYDVFIHRLRSCIGSMLMSLNGLDGLVFTAGIGEHSAPVRQSVCDGMEFLGIQLDPQKNENHPKDADIATSSSKVRVFVIHTQEDWAIARDTWQVLHPNHP